MVSVPAFLTLFALSQFSSALSVFGSVSILYLISKKKKWPESIFHRIMIGLSAADTLWSVTNMAQNFMLPVESGLITAFGNSTTCNIAGLLGFTIATSSMYSGVLSLYFFLTISKGWSEVRVKRFLEPWIHVVSWGMPTILAILITCFGGFQPTVLGICLAPDNDEAPVLLKLATFLTIPVIFVPAVVGFVLIWLMHASVRRQRSRNQRYDFSPSDQARQQQTRAIAIQGMFYSLAYFNTFIAVVLFAVLRSAFAETELFTEATQESGMPKEVFYWSIFIYTLLPLQGFFNWIIYVRPTLVQWKSSNTEKSWWWAYRQVVSGNPTPRGKSGDSLIQGPAKSVVSGLTIELPESAITKTHSNDAVPSGNDDIP